MIDHFHSKIKRFEQLAGQIQKHIESDEPLPQEQLYSLDAQISELFESLINSRLNEVSELILRVRFLLSQLHTYSEQNGLDNRIHGQIVRDLDEIESKFAKPTAVDIELKQPASTQLIELCYSSHALTDFGDRELSDLMHQSSKNNQLKDITGVLVYENRSSIFYQILEGPDAAVTKLMAEIAEDSRHQDIDVHLKNPITKRSFEKWDMLVTSTSRLKHQKPSSVSFIDWFEKFLGTKPQAARTKGYNWMFLNVSASIV